MPLATTPLSAVSGRLTNAKLGDDVIDGVSNLVNQLPDQSVDTVLVTQGYRTAVEAVTLVVVEFGGPCLVQGRRDIAHIFMKIFGEFLLVLFHEAQGSAVKRFV